MRERERERERVGASEPERESGRKRVERKDLPAKCAKRPVTPR